MARLVRARSGSHLQRIGDTWYYRRVVPPEARHVFGKGEIKISLGTTSRLEAERLEKPHDVEFEARLQQARESGEVPQRKRRLSRDDVDLVAFEYGGGRVAELDHLYTELNTVIPELAPPQWPELRAAIVRLVEGHVANLGTQYTLDWAYDSWQRAKDRPEQTDDEARRYLDDFMASARVSTLAEVRRSHILKWRKSLQDAGKLAPKSINQRLELVAAILRTGWRDAEMQPVDLQKINVPEPTDSPRSKWGKGDLLEALHALALPDEPEWARWLYVIALTTGTRIGEPVAARREWYDPLGFIDAPKSATKKRKYHVMPIIELIREPLERHVAALQPGEYLFPEAPRPGNPKLKISHEVSKWFSRFRERHGIPKVVHELRHTFKEAARASPIKKEIHDIITGHSPATEADKYGGAEPSELLASSEIICAKFLDAELVTAIKRLFI